MNGGPLSEEVPLSDWYSPTGEPGYTNSRASSQQLNG